MKPILQPILRQPLLPIGGSLPFGGGLAALPVPEGFDWTPPVNVFRSADGVYSTDFNSADWRHVTTADLYIAPTGNNVSGSGTEASPWRSLAKALTEAAALADEAITIHVAAGSGDRTTLAGYVIDALGDKKINIIAEGGRARMSTRFEAQSWSVHSAGVYTASRASVLDVVDASLSATDTSTGRDLLIHTRLPKAASLAECESTPGTWFQSGTPVYVHLHDGRAPDAGCLLFANLTNFRIETGPELYIEGIDFEGATSSLPVFQMGDTATATGLAVFNDCTFSMSRLDGLAGRGTPLILSNNCAAFNNLADGFNYHGGGVSGVDTNFVEIGCVGFLCGSSADPDNDQGSTLHEDGRGLRVNGVYSQNNGQGIADVTTSQSWNLGCVSKDSVAPGETQNSGFAASGTASIWLDGCEATGVDFSLYAASGAIIYHRDCTLGAPTGGAGTITTY